MLKKHKKAHDFEARERLKRRLHEIELRRINDILGALRLEEGEHFETGRPQSYCIGEGQLRLLQLYDGNVAEMDGMKDRVGNIEDVQSK